MSSSAAIAAACASELTLNGWRTRFSRSATDGVHHAEADAKPCEAVGLGECPRHDQVRIASDPVDGIGLVGWIEELVVGLVEDDQDLARNRIDEGLDASGRVPGSRGIVGIGDEHDPRARRDRGAHRIQVVSIVLRRDLGPDRAAGLRRQRIDDEGVLRPHRMVAGAQERLRDQFQHVVAAVAQHDRVGAVPEPDRQRVLELVAVAVGIAVEVARRRRDRLAHARTRAAWILVRSEFHDRRGVEVHLARELLDRLAADIRCDAAHVFRRLCRRVGRIHGFLQLRAAG